MIINVAAIIKSLTYQNFFITLSQPNLPANGIVECLRRTEDRHLQVYSFKVGVSDTRIGTVPASGHFLFLLRPMMSDQSHYIPLQAIMNHHVTTTRRFCLAHFRSNHVIKKNVQQIYYICIPLFVHFTKTDFTIFESY